MFHGLKNGSSSPPCADDRRLSMKPLDPESEAIALASLKCLTHLFSWIPLSSLITPSLVNTIFIYASIGTDPRVSIYVDFYNRIT